MKKPTLVAIHGFLGRPADFDDFAENFKEECENQINFLAIDYMNIRGLTPDVPLNSWGENFNIWLNKNLPQVPKFALGYSMGGRLLLHALKNSKSAISKAIFVSTNTGLKTASEKAKRLQNDQKWAQRFKTAEFARVVADWNKQEVFEGSAEEPNRFEQDYDRELLAMALTKWSLSQQDDFSAEISKFKIPQKWIAGEEDSKYVKLLAGLEDMNPELQFSVVPGASHRVHFDQPKKLADRICKFINQ